MRLMSNKTKPELAVLFEQQEVAMNVARCQEYFMAAQTGQLRGQLHEEGVTNLQVGNHGPYVVLLVSFTDSERMKEWCLDRKAYTMEEFSQVCREFGKDPNQLLQQSQQQQGQSFTFTMG